MRSNREQLKEEERKTKEVKYDRKESLWSVRWYNLLFFVSLLLATSWRCALFFFFYLIRCFWVYVALLFFLMSASLLIPRHSCTNLSLQLHIVKCRKIREQEKTQTHTHEHARTHRHTIIIHKHGGTTTTSSIATHRVFVHSVDSVFYFIIFLVQMVVVHVFASSTENWKYLRILIFFLLCDLFRQ